MFIFNADYALQVSCARCQQVIQIEEAQHCWFCTRHLCYNCWEMVGHCGHPEAYELNEKMKQVSQEEQK